jgi:hypothetical protein
LAPCITPTIRRPFLSAKHSATSRSADHFPAPLAVILSALRVFLSVRMTLAQSSVNQGCTLEDVRMMQLSRLALAVCLLALLGGSVFAQCGPHGCAVGVAPGPIHGHTPFVDTGPAYGYGHDYFTLYGGVYEAIALIERPHPQANLFPNMGWTLYPGQAGSGVPSMSSYSHINGVLPPSVYVLGVMEKLHHLGIARHPPDTKFLHKNPAIGDNLNLPTPKAWVPKLDEEEKEMPGDKRSKDTLPKPKDGDKDKDKSNNKSGNKGDNKNSSVEKEVIGRPAVETEKTPAPDKKSNNIPDDKKSNNTPGK